MSRLALRLGVAAGAALLCGAAERSDLTPAFTGTIVSTYPDGRTAELWLNADGSYIGEGRRHGRSAGRWTIRGQRICLRQSRPPDAALQLLHGHPLRRRRRELVGQGGDRRDHPREAGSGRPLSRFSGNGDDRADMVARAGRKRLEQGRTRNDER